MPSEHALAAGGSFPGPAPPVAPAGAVRSPGQPLTPGTRPPGSFLRLHIRPIPFLIVVALTLAIVWGAWRAIRVDPLDQARRAYEHGELRIALRQAVARARTHPNDEAAALLAARCLTRLGETGAAESYYRRAGTLAEDDLQARALGLVQANRPDQAIECYEAILRRSPDSATALERLAAVRIGQQRWNEALTPAKRLAGLPGSEVPGQTLLGVIHHNARRPGQAVAAFERVLAIDPLLQRLPIPSALFWDHLALDLLALGRPKDARGYLVRALGERHDGRLMELIGLSYYNEGHLARAEQCWKSAVEWAPDNADAWLGLGRLTLGRGNAADALPLLEQAAQLAPASYEPYFSMSQAHRLLGNATEAERCRLLADERRQPSRGR